MPSLLASGTDTFTYLDAYQPDRAEESESILSWAQWCPRIRNKQPLYQDLDISEERRTLLLVHLLGMLLGPYVLKICQRHWKTLML